MAQPHIAWNFTPVPDGWQKKPEDYEKITEILAGNWVERGLRYYSGKGVYEKTFDFEDLTPGRTYLLDLGLVGVGAKVWLNGNLIGERLWTPYRFDLTRYLRKGPNALRISVVNTLANYFSQFDFLKDKPLYEGGGKPWMLPSGLIGPVTIRSYRQ
jgi:beta-galactosidase/beta-glucuronidase